MLKLVVNLDNGVLNFMVKKQTMMISIYLPMNIKKLLMQMRSALYDVEGDDTINAAAVTSACFIDLNDGAASQIGLSEFLIAENVFIEDVFTGDGNDFITGNEKNNSLNSGRGNDRFIASGGDDYIDGGFGYDEIIYDAN